MTRRDEILAGIKLALTGIVEPQFFYETLGEVIDANASRSIVVAPFGFEDFDGKRHPLTVDLPTGPRRFPVSVWCTAWTRAEAYEMAEAVEDAFPYGETAHQIAADFSGSTPSDYGGTPERRTKHIFFSVNVQFTVYYERATG